MAARGRPLKFGLVKCPPWLRPLVRRAEALRVAGAVAFHRPVDFFVVSISSSASYDERATQTVVVDCAASEVSLVHGERCGGSDPIELPPAGVVFIGVAARNASGSSARVTANDGLGLRPWASAAPSAVAVLPPLGNLPALVVPSDAAASSRAYLPPYVSNSRAVRCMALLVAALRCAALPDRRCSARLARVRPGAAACACARARVRVCAYTRVCSMLHQRQHRCNIRR